MCVREEEEGFGADYGEDAHRGRGRRRDRERAREGGQRDGIADQYQSPSHHVRRALERERLGPLS